jgi:hypothetical protein
MSHILPTWEANLLARETNPLAQDVSRLVGEVSEEPSRHDQEDLPKEDVLASINMSMVNSSVSSSSKLIGAPIDANEN